MVARDFVRLLVCGITAFTAAALPMTGLGLKFDGLGYKIVAMVSSSLLCGHLYRPGRSSSLDRVVYGLESFGLFSVISIVGAVLTYVVASVSTGWVDQYLIAGDRLLGINWLAYWSFDLRHPFVGDALRIGYKSFFLSPMVCLIALAAVGQIDRCYRFISAYTVALVITGLSLAIFPAHSAEYYYLGPHAGLPDSGLAHVPIINGLRNGSIHAINLADLKGLCAFPSFHAASCVILVWCSWTLKWLRPPMLAINALMLASTPLEGGHYFTDIVAGVVVGAAAIALSEYLLLSASRRALVGNAQYGQREPRPV